MKTSNMTYQISRNCPLTSSTSSTSSTKPGSEFYCSIQNVNNNDHESYLFSGAARKINPVCFETF